MGVSFSDETIRDLESLLQENGFFYVAGLPNDFDHLEFIRRFGPTMPQYHGGEVWQVQPSEKYEHTYHSLNRAELYPHTECYEFEGLPPRYQAFWCVRPAEDGGGATTICDTYGFLKTLSGEDRRHLERKRRFESSDGIKSSGLARSAVHPILERGSGGKLVIRLSFNCMRRDEDDADWLAQFFDRFRQHFQTNHIRIGWIPGALLMFDNWRYAHSRTAFEDWNRLLKRVWVTENRASAHG